MQIIYYLFFICYISSKNILLNYFLKDLRYLALVNNYKKGTVQYKYDVVDNYVVVDCSELFDFFYMLKQFLELKSLDKKATEEVIQKGLDPYKLKIDYEMETRNCIKMKNSNYIKVSFYNNDYSLTLILTKESSIYGKKIKLRDVDIHKRAGNLDSNIGYVYNAVYLDPGFRSKVLSFERRFKRVLQQLFHRITFVPIYYDIVYTCQDYVIYDFLSVSYSDLNYYYGVEVLVRKEFKPYSDYYHNNSDNKNENNLKIIKIYRNINKH